ncbi:hypothetical protein PRK78_001765 [Emydomyces testavorans]|uniref:Uncharacterized protein n=1 Tax=Emydomyces testavorans TaxID=2070801 RepID=A0AAF0IGZ8_9EURO|nr:hypothetical protein PRK78_001765 [Emydomyces testavorans]
MASKYDLLEYDSDEEKQKYPVVPRENLTSAALFMAGLLDRAGILYGVMGGFAIVLMGGNRETRDIDIAFQAPGKMRDLWAVVETESRLVIPNTKLLSNIMKVFVLTGHGHDTCATAMPIEVDLIENGYQNSPRDLSTNRVQLLVQLDSEMKPIYVIGCLYLLKGKLSAYFARRGHRDRSDIMHLVDTFPDEIQGFASELDPEAVAFFLDSMPAGSRKTVSSLFGY